MPEARPSKKKQARSKSVEVLDINKPEAIGSRARKASAVYLGLEEKLEQLINTVGMIANNLAGLFELQEAAALLDKSYGFGMVVLPLDLGSSELNSDELHEEAEWLKAHGEDEEKESEGEDESMAKAK
ncbi:hypothetical protein M404DRAFT_27501 [Pisolithus tinctorius Marx 270]|uniref:Uncharacterized protein n=1 Tax=Pisolithus tinctorius Marx 270 TaxID=870435 RepID=A0A0C3J1G3_PISTI|nr:hypothetical protein M404DRAFT_27501 [Pisolithus tinctorius Marx 270]